MKLLIYRFSALGDVAMCLPVIQGLLAKNPNLEIVFCSQKSFSFLFKDIDRLKFFEADLKNKYKGVSGIYNLWQDLKQVGPFDAVIDLHQVTRTQILNFFIGFNSKILKIDKARSEKKKAIKDRSKIKLKHTIQRYLDTFEGLELKLPKFDELNQWGYNTNTFDSVNSLLNKSTKKKIGIAPFAKHFTKIWPLENLKVLIKMLSEYDVYLFGGGDAEIKILEELSREFNFAFNSAGKFKFSEELAIMEKMDVMVVMDSANMHFSSLVKTKTIVIWGGTHPNMGFSAINPKTINISLNLECSPCSVFGKESCPKTHFECMKNIRPDFIFSEIQKIIV